MKQINSQKLSENKAFAATSANCARGGGNSLQNNVLEAAVAASTGLIFDLCSTRNFSTFYNFIVSVAENIFGIFGYVYRNSVACYRNLVARYENSVACYENFVACYENSVACYGNFVVCYRNLVACYENFVACYENLKWFPALTEISKYQININIETQDNLRNLFTFFKKKRIIRSSR